MSCHLSYSTYFRHSACSAGHLGNPKQPLGDFPEVSPELELALLQCLFPEPQGSVVNFLLTDIGLPAQGEHREMEGQKAHSSSTLFWLTCFIAVGFLHYKTILLFFCEATSNGWWKQVGCTHGVFSLPCSCRFFLSVYKHVLNF